MNNMMPLHSNREYKNSLQSSNVINNSKNNYKDVECKFIEFFKDKLRSSLLEALQDNQLAYAKDNYIPHSTIGKHLKKKLPYLEHRTAYPFLSSNVLKAIPDHYYVREYNFSKHPVLEGDVIYCDEFYLADFILQQSNIKQKYILITLLGDIALPGLYSSLLSTKNLHKWFVTNLESFHTDPRLVQIPIGMNDLGSFNNEYSKVSKVLKHTALNMKPFSKRKISVYVNVMLRTSPFRPVLTDLLQSYSRCGNLSAAYFNTIKIPFSEYMQHLKDSRFVVCPPGRGLDTHRTWEALAAGAIPIVLGSDINPIYEHLPIVILQDWRQLTDHYLENFLRKMVESTNFTFQ